MKPNPIQLFEQLVAANGGQLPDTVKLTRYESFEDWHLPAEDGPATPADFAVAQKTTNDFAAHLTRRGVKVRGVTFDPAAYHQWRDNRSDTRDLRAQWATSSRCRKLELAFVVGDSSIGWVVLES